MYSDQLKILRAEEGIIAFRKLIQDLTSLGPKIGLMFFTDSYEAGLDIVSKDIKASVPIYFDPTSDECQRFVKAADFKMVPNTLGTKDEIKRALETNIAASQDVLQDAIHALEDRIAALKSGGIEKSPPREKPPAPTPAQDPASSSSSSDRPIIHLKPTFMGISIDLNELWRRMCQK
jgi:hypothetical protein